MHFVKVALVVAGVATGLAVVACSAGSSAPPASGLASGSGGAFGAPPGGGGGVGIFGTGGDTVINIDPMGSGGAAVVGGLPDGSVISAEQPESVDDCGAGNAAGLDAAGVTALQQGSGSAGAVRLLSPYDGTVFPRGLIAPLVMWDGGAADTVYLHIKSSMFEYKGCFKPTSPGQLQVPQPVWEKAGNHAHGPTDPFTVELTLESGGVSTGPVTEHVVIAQATLKGTIYYNSYASKLTGNPAGSSGAVLRIVPGKPAEEFLETGVCIGCHSVSANGSRLVADPVLDLTGGATFALTPNGPANPPRLAATAKATAFTAVSPDGSVYLSSAHQGGLGCRGGTADTLNTIFGTGANATLYETDTGNAITGTNIPTGAMTPMFSPDGSLLVFNDFAIDSGHGLATMTYDKTARTAAGYTKLLSVTDPATWPSWPFFLPDDLAVLFTIGTTKDFSGANLGINGQIGVVSSDVYVADVASGTQKILANAMGYASDADAAAGKTYLPFGAEELHHNFYPTGSPVAAGGYFWVFFDSYRHYGNTHAGAMVRQLWGTAVDISSTGSYTTDPSHPPFYLTGQEDVEGNHRAFTALDPCKADGDTCATGIDCCVGFCTNGVCGKPPPVTTGPTCVKTDDSCAGGATCCNPNDRCINGFCGQIAR